MSPLKVLQTRIAERASAVSQSCSDWPCRAGCDTCCKSLADIPRMSLPEWELLKSALSALNVDTRESILQRAYALQSAARPIQCPMLDVSSGRCLVYEARPIACRTYGFYRERDQGLYCEMIRKRVDSGEFDQVVWGNAETLEPLGEERDLLDWLRHNY